MALFPQGYLQIAARCRNTEGEEWRLLDVALTHTAHRLVLVGCGEYGVDSSGGIIFNKCNFKSVDWYELEVLPIFLTSTAIQLA